MTPALIPGVEQSKFTTKCEETPLIRGPTFTADPYMCLASGINEREHGMAETGMTDFFDISGNSTCLDDAFAGHLACGAGRNAQVVSVSVTIFGRNHRWQTSATLPKAKDQLAQSLNKFSDLIVVGPVIWMVG